MGHMIALTAADEHRLGAYSVGPDDAVCDRFAASGHMVRHLRPA